MGEYKIGIVGYGYISTVRHIPGYRKDKRAEIVSIVGPDNKIKKRGFKPRTALREGILNLKNWFEEGK